MPIEQRNTSRQFTTVAAALIFLAAAVTIVVLGIKLVSGSGSSAVVRMGQDKFDAGSPKLRMKAIKADGPILFSDVSGRGQNRPIFLSHTGDDAFAGWLAFEAKAPGTASGCYLRWDLDKKVFVSEDADGKSCDSATFPVDGKGLTQYPVELDGEGEKAVLMIDLNPDKGKATTTTTPASTTAVGG